MVVGPGGISIANLTGLPEPLIEKREFSHDKMSKRHMDVSENRGTPKSSISKGFSIINHPFWGTTIFGNTHIMEKYGPVDSEDLMSH